MDKNYESSYVIGVAGGTGSGKTTVVQEIVKAVDAKSVAIIQHDSYYLDRSHLSETEREQINYDHPDALETDLLIQHIVSLISGEAVKVPIYDFSTHTRSNRTKLIEPCKVNLLNTK